MRYLDTMPAWAARQRSRRLVRHSDEKVVRWINHNYASRDEGTDPADRGQPSTNDNDAAFTPSRSMQVS